MPTTVRVLLTLVVLAAAGFLKLRHGVLLPILALDFRRQDPTPMSSRLRRTCTGYITDLRVHNDQFVPQGRHSLCHRPGTL